MGGGIKLDYAHHDVSHGGGDKTRLCSPRCKSWGGGWIKLDYAHHDVSHEGGGGGG